MKRIIFAFVLVFMTGCFSAATSLRSGNLNYEAAGINAPAPMEMAAADKMSADSEYVRAQARTLETHPEMFTGWNNWGGGSYQNYYYPYYAGGAGQPTASQIKLEGRVDKLEQGHASHEKRFKIHEKRMKATEDFLLRQEGGDR